MSSSQTNLKRIIQIAARWRKKIRWKGGWHSEIYGIENFDFMLGDESWYFSEKSLKHS